MAQWSHLVVSRLHLDWLRAFVLETLAIANFTQADSSSVTCAGAAKKELGSRHLRQLSSSIFETVFNSAREQFIRIINGQLGAWDIVQLIAACSLVQTIRLWKNRNRIQRKGNDHSSCSAVGGCFEHKSTEALSWKNSGSMKAGKYQQSPIMVMKMGLRSWH